MKDLLTDINAYLTDGAYKNEEHVRLSLVSRILDYLGWDIWNPREVYPEYYAIPSEDRSRVDLALFLKSNMPSVFLEIKAVGKIDFDLPIIERQLRDYNRNLTALFSIITDGRKWRFYHSQAGGEFSQKCFKTIDLLEDDLNDIETFFNAFLAKPNVDSGDAEKDARKYLQLNLKQRAMGDALPQARRMVDEPPFPSLPHALIERVAVAGHKISIEEATEFIRTYKPIEQPLSPKPLSKHPMDIEPQSRELSEIENWTPSTYSAGKEALMQVLDVAELMLFKSVEFGDAAVQVALRKGITHGTVRHSCTRALGLDTFEFKALIKDAKRTITFLQKKYPEYVYTITERLQK
ncbi:MAG: type I restriction enzyme HsdR N-terminal domain-containing protein [Ignavibacteriales bacterium]|nr:type I restriction enzyme HsdR N-terminal domain-containing protein [Ignavibacteriales bacterium]MBI3788209.1 type I restriction enzyme HsdR N-terminal domain-containing protein [Ignavibacteriales bacterium]